MSHHTQPKRALPTTKPCTAVLPALRDRWVMLIIATFTFVALLLSSTYLRAPPPADPVLCEDRQQPSGVWSDDLRVAWVVPYLSAAAMPTYASFCFRTVAASAPYVQLFVFYENASMILPDVSAANIHYIPVGENGVVNRLVKELKRGLGEKVTGPAEQEVRDMLRGSPRRLGVYKPLFASAFQDYIGEYSHWAWGDIDTLIGDVVGLVSEADLRAFDAISFTRGVGHLYLQGQLTILANQPYVNSAWKNAPKVGSLATSDPVYAWEEVFFSEWALYKSDLHIKIMPLHLTANLPEEWSPGGMEDGNRSDVIWENGRLLDHSPFAPKTSFFPEDATEAPLIYQPTWTGNPQRPGPWVLERRGSNENCTWYGSRRKASGYDQRTQEFIVFHYSYEHENRVVNALAKKEPNAVRVLLQKPRLAFQYNPFDFIEAPPCGTPGGGNCPSPG